MERPTCGTCVYYQMTAQYPTGYSEGQCRRRSRMDWPRRAGGDVVIGLMVSLLVMVVFWRVLLWIDRYKGPARLDPQFRQEIRVIAGERLRPGQAVYLGSDGKVREARSGEPAGRWGVAMDGRVAWADGVPLVTVGRPG